LINNVNRIINNVNRIGSVWRWCCLRLASTTGWCSQPKTTMVLDSRIHCVAWWLYTRKEEVTNAAW